MDDKELEKFYQANVQGRLTETEKSKKRRLDDLDEDEGGNKDE